MKNDINDGIRILVERIQTHPLEFFDECGRTKLNGKWVDLIDMVYLRRTGKRQVFTEEELDLVDVAMSKVERKLFTTRVMEVLFAEQQNNV